MPTNEGVTPPAPRLSAGRVVYRAIANTASGALGRRDFVRRVACPAPSSRQKGTSLYFGAARR
eukprot:6041980-Prymnesium_polylepis.1